jgi:hypothetical protein
MIPDNENRSSMKFNAKTINNDNEELQMPPIIAKITTGGDKMLR